MYSRFTLTFSEIYNTCFKRNMYFRFYALIFRSRCLFLKSTVLAKIERLILAKIRSCFWCQRLLCRCCLRCLFQWLLGGRRVQRAWIGRCCCNSRWPWWNNNWCSKARLGRGGQKQTTRRPGVKATWVGVCGIWLAKAAGIWEKDWYAPGAFACGRVAGSGGAALELGGI